MQGKTEDNQEEKYTPTFLLRHNELEFKKLNTVRKYFFPRGSKNSAILTMIDEYYERIPQEVRDSAETADLLTTL